VNLILQWGTLVGQRLGLYELTKHLYDRIKSAGVNLERSTIHDRILETVVFILTNTEESLSAALAADESAPGR
jgi:hypothetical protein